MTAVIVSTAPYSDKDRRSNHKFVVKFSGAARWDRGPARLYLPHTLIATWSPTTPRGQVFHIYQCDVRCHKYASPNAPRAMPGQGATVTVYHDNWGILPGDVQEVLLEHADTRRCLDSVILSDPLRASVNAYREHKGRSPALYRLPPDDVDAPEYGL